MDGGGGWQGPRLKSEAIDFAEGKLKKDTCGRGGVNYCCTFCIFCEKRVEKK